MSSTIVSLSVQFLFLFTIHIHSCTWSPTTCGCSKVKIAANTRIVGGTEAKKYSWPWIVSIRRYGSHVCGGTLISNEFVISAAHCFSRLNSTTIKDFSMVMGHHGRTEKYFVSKAKRIIIHKNYSLINGIINDIAFIQLETRANFSDSRLGFICLPTQHAKDGDKYPAPGKMTWAAGWGTLKFHGESSAMLMQVQLPIVGPAVCKSKVSSVMKQVCAGYEQGGKDTCQGDSGGPLIYSNEKGVFELIGIVSYGAGCAAPKEPGVYTRVASYIDWIDVQRKIAASQPNPGPSGQHNYDSNCQKPSGLQGSATDFYELSYFSIYVATFFMLIVN